MEIEVNPRELEAQVIRLLKVTMSEIYDCDEEYHTTPEGLVEAILEKSEVALTTTGKEELVNHLKSIIR